MYYSLCIFLFCLLVYFGDRELSRSYVRSDMGRRGCRRKICAPAEYKSRQRECVWERNNWQLRLQLQLQFGCIYTSATKFSAASTTLHKSFISAFYMTRTSVMGPCSLINSLPNVTAAGIQSNFLYQEKHTHMHRGCICQRMDELDRAHQSESM